MFGKPGKIWVRTCASKDLGIPRSNHAPALTLECASHNRCTTVACTSVHSLVHKIDKIIGETNRDLLAHTKTVADWYRTWPRARPVGLFGVRPGRLAHDAVAVLGP